MTYTYMTTHVTCRDCGHELIYVRETAGEPGHCKCGNCGTRWTLAGKRWNQLGKVQYHQHEEMTDGPRCPTGECNVPLTEV